VDLGDDQVGALHRPCTGPHQRREQRRMVAEDTQDLEGGGAEPRDEVRHRGVRRRQGAVKRGPPGLPRAAAPDSGKEPDRPARRG